MTPAPALWGDRSLVARIGLAIGGAGLVLIAAVAALTTAAAIGASEHDAVQAARNRLAPLAALAAADRRAAERLVAGDGSVGLIADETVAAGGEPRLPAPRFLTPTARAGQALDATRPGATTLLDAAADAPSGELRLPVSLLRDGEPTPVRVLWQRAANDAPLAIAEIDPAALRAGVVATALRWTAGALLLALLLGLLLVHALQRWLARPIADLQRRLQRLADGDLSAPRLATGGGEIARLHHAVDGLSDRYAKAFGSLRHSIDRIAAASASIAQSNAASRAAAAPAAGMLQISGDAAREADALARSAAEAATQGGAVVTQVVHTIGDVQQSARRIAEIVGQIDGLAFQTNLLALNASVQAAKAGDGGRGFSIVAGEVRVLAQRSAAAAKEIRAQLGLCNEKLDTGSRLVETAGAAMNQIMHSVRRVAQVTAEFGGPAPDGQAARPAGAALSAQQSTLLGQTAQAAEQLREQAQRLADIMAAFRMAEQAQTASREVIARLRAAAAPDEAAGTGDDPAAAPSSPASPAAPAIPTEPAAPSASPAANGAPQDPSTRPVPNRLPPPRPTGATAFPPMPPVPPAPEGEWEQF